MVGEDVLLLVDYLQLEVAQAALFDVLGTVIEQYEGQHMRQPTAHARGSQAAPCLQ
jgi:hypothetical protein